MNVIGQRRRIFLLRCSLSLYCDIILQSLNIRCCNAEPIYYNWTRPLMLRLVRRLNRGVRRHQRIPQLAHSLVT